MAAPNQHQAHGVPESEWPASYGGMLLGPAEGKDKLFLCLDVPTSELAINALAHHVKSPGLIIRKGYGTLLIPDTLPDGTEYDIPVIDFSTIKLQNVRIVYKALKDAQEGKSPVSPEMELRTEPALRRLGEIAAEVVEAEPKLAALTHDDQRPIYDAAHPETLWTSERVSAYLSLNPIFEPFGPPFEQ